METLHSVESSAMSLSEKERALLASHLLESLPAQLLDEDEGVAEALRRDAELDADPSAGMTFDELRVSLGR